MGIKIQLKRFQENIKTTFFITLKVSFPLYSNYAFVEAVSHSYDMFKKDVTHNICIFEHLDGSKFHFHPLSILTHTILR